MIPRVPEKLGGPGRRLAQNGVPRDELVGAPTQRGQVHGPHVVAEQVCCSHAVAGHGDEELVIVGVVGSPRRVDPDDHSIGAEFDKSPTDRLPAGARTHVHGEITIGELLGLHRRLVGMNRDALVPADLAFRVEREYEGAAVVGDFGHEVPRRHRPDD